MDTVCAITEIVIHSNSTVLPIVHTDMNQAWQDVSPTELSTTASMLEPDLPTKALTVALSTLTPHVILQRSSRTLSSSMMTPTALTSKTSAMVMDSLCAHGSYHTALDLSSQVLSSVSKLSFGTATTHGPTMMKLVISTTTSHALVSELHLESMLAIVECSLSLKDTKSSRYMRLTPTSATLPHGLTLLSLHTTAEIMPLSQST